VLSSPKASAQQLLNWRRDPDDERRMLEFKPRKMQQELRMKQLRSEILLMRRTTEQPSN
jgi:hypothetical protein